MPSVEPMHNPHPLSRGLKRGMPARRPSTRLHARTQTDDLRARQSGPSTIWSTRNLNACRSDEQNDDVPLIPKTKRRRWRLKGGPTNVNENDGLLDRAVGEADAERNVCGCTRSTTSSSSNRKFSSEPSCVHTTLAFTSRRLSLVQCHEDNGKTQENVPQGSSSRDRARRLRRRRASFVLALHLLGHFVTVQPACYFHFLNDCAFFF